MYMIRMIAQTVNYHYAYTDKDHVKSGQCIYCTASIRYF
jgi:hypothetical protein